MRGIKALHAEIHRLGLAHDNSRTMVQADAAAVILQHEGDIHDRCKHVGGGCYMKKQ